MSGLGLGLETRAGVTLLDPAWSRSTLKPRPVNSKYSPKGYLYAIHTRYTRALHAGGGRVGPPTGGAVLGVREKASAVLVRVGAGVGLGLG